MYQKTAILVCENDLKFSSGIKVTFLVVAPKYYHKQYQRFETSKYHCMLAYLVEAILCFPFSCSPLFLLFFVKMYERSSVSNLSKKSRERTRKNIFDLHTTESRKPGDQIITLFCEYGGGTAPVHDFR